MSKEQCLVIPRYDWMSWYCVEVTVVVDLLVMAVLTKAARAIGNRAFFLVRLQLVVVRASACLESGSTGEEELECRTG